MNKISSKIDIKITIIILLGLVIIITWLFPALRTVNITIGKPVLLSSKLKTIDASESASLEQVQTLYDIGKTEMETVTGSFNTMLTLILVMLAILGVGFTLVTVFTTDRIKEIDRLLTEAKSKNDTLNEQIVAAGSQKGATGTLPTQLNADAQETTQVHGNQTTNVLSNSDSLQFIKYHHFEKMYRLIFGSQLSILRMLFLIPEHTTTGPILEAIHRRSKFADIPFDMYIGFLTSNLLMGQNSDDSNYFITPLGIEFLNYLFQNGIPDKVE